MLHKTLSIKNPLSYTVCIGEKDIENRSWNTDFRGTLLIHSSSGENLDSEDKLFKAVWGQDYSDISAENRQVFAELLDHMGGVLYTHAIIGCVDVVDVVQDSKSEWAVEDQYHWVLKNAKVFRNPILDVKGQVKFWNYEPGVDLKKVEAFEFYDDPEAVVD